MPPVFKGLDDLIVDLTYNILSPDSCVLVVKHVMKSLKEGSKKRRINKCPDSPRTARIRTELSKARANEKTALRELAKLKTADNIALGRKVQVGNGKRAVAIKRTQRSKKKSW